MEKAGFETVETANLEHWVEQAISRDVILGGKREARHTRIILCVFFLKSAYPSP